MSLQVVILAVLKASIVLSLTALGLRENFSDAIFLFGSRPSWAGHSSP